MTNPANPTYNVSAEMPDYSGWQPTPNYEALARSGYWGCMEKVSEGGNVMGSFMQRLPDLVAVKKAHPNFRLGLYHFARPGNGIQEAAIFLNAIAPLLALGGTPDISDYDLEVSGISQLQIDDFHGTIAVHAPVLERWHYEGAFFIPENGHSIPPGVKWHLPAYGSTYPKVAGTPLDRLISWQCTNSATTPGVPTPADLSLVFEVQGGPAPVNPHPVEPHLGLVAGLQSCIYVSRDGIWGPQTDTAMLYVRAGRASGDVALLQHYIGVVTDGIWGTRTQAAYTNAVKCLQSKMGCPVDGLWGPVTERFYEAFRTRYRVG